MDGVILVHKPQNITSHDVVVKIRNILNTKKVGHYGTLDPLATGLILIAVGKATKLFPYFSKTDKVYKGGIRLGFSTDTYDSTGKPISSESKKYPEKDNLANAMKKFEGRIQQVPPPYSAKKYKGKPLYKLARGGKEFELRPSQLFIHYFRLINYNPPFIECEIKCSSGTYVRSLAHDLGQIIGCGAHLYELLRTQVGNFQLKESFPIEKINQLSQEGKIKKFLIPLEFLLPEFPKVILQDRGSALAKNGNIVFAENIIKVIQGESFSSGNLSEKEKIFRMFNGDGKLLALAKKVPEKNGFHPFLVIDSDEGQQ